MVLFADDISSIRIAVSSIRIATTMKAVANRIGSGTSNRITNPWLEVPLADYENHMNLAGVEQAPALSELFADSLAYCQPESVAVIGIAGGNGLDRIDTRVTRRVVIEPTNSAGDD